MKNMIFLGLALGALTSSCKKQVVTARPTPIASQPDTTDAKGWSGLRDSIDPTSWQARELK